MEETKLNMPLLGDDFPNLENAKKRLSEHDGSDWWFYHKKLE